MADTLEYSGELWPTSLPNMSISTWRQVQSVKFNVVETSWFERQTLAKSWPEMLQEAAPELQVVNFAHSAATCNNTLFPRWPIQVCLVLHDCALLTSGEGRRNTDRPFQSVQRASGDGQGQNISSHLCRYQRLNLFRRSRSRSTSHYRLDVAGHNDCRRGAMRCQPSRDALSYRLQESTSLWKCSFTQDCNVFTQSERRRQLVFLSALNHFLQVPLSQPKWTRYCQTNEGSRHAQQLVTESIHQNSSSNLSRPQYLHLSHLRSLLKRNRKSSLISWRGRIRIFYMSRRLCVEGRGSRTVPEIRLCRYCASVNGGIEDYYESCIGLHQGTTCNIEELKSCKSWNIRFGWCMIQNCIVDGLDLSGEL